MKEVCINILTGLMLLFGVLLILALITGIVIFMIKFPIEFIYIMEAIVFLFYLHHLGKGFRNGR